MTLRHLRIFSTVAELGSITAAAKKLYIAQPSVSIAIRELEEYYGVKLFERLGRSISITENGKRLWGYAAHIVQMVDEMETSMKTADDFLRIGASITVGTHYIPGYVERFRRLRPQVIVKVHIASSDEIERMILSNQLDMGLIEGVVHSGFITAEKYRDDFLVPVCSARHRWRKEAPDYLEFLQEPLLLREPGSGTRELLDNKLALLGLHAEPLWESTSTEALINGVIGDSGVSVLPLQLVRERLGQHLLVSPDIPELKISRELKYMYHKNKYIGKAMRDFIALL